MSKPRLVMFHPNMGLLGGAQRDLIVALPEHAKRWSITCLLYTSDAADE